MKWLAPKTEQELSGRYGPKGHWGSTSCDLAVVKEDASMSPWSLATAKAQSSEVLAGPQKTPRRLAAGSKSMSWSLEHQKGRWFDLEGFLKKGDRDLVTLGQRFLHGHICSDPFFKEVQIATREQKLYR